MKNIVIKILPKYYEDVISGNKTFELRRKSYGVEKGDIITLEEEGSYRKSKYIATYVLSDVEQYGLDKDYCIISIKPIDN